MTGEWKWYFQKGRYLRKGGTYVVNIYENIYGAVTMLKWRIKDFAMCNFAM